MKRPIAGITIEWDPNTGTAFVAPTGCNLMEQLGLLDYARELLLQKVRPTQQENLVIPVNGEHAQRGS